MDLLDRAEVAADRRIPFATNRMSILVGMSVEDATAAAVEALAADQVALVQGLDAEAADRIIKGVAKAFGRQDHLEMQAAFASVHGHRENVSKYFMTVNKRDEYQFIPAHSEGTRLTNMQLTALYCFENSTDGGETVLLNTDQDSPAWGRLKEQVTRIHPSSRKMSPTEMAMAKVRFQINAQEDLLLETDTVLFDRPSPIEGVQLVTALTSLRRTRSTILDQEVFSYWDSVSNRDFTSAEAFMELLQQHDAIRLPEDDASVERLDGFRNLRCWRSDVRLPEIFKGMIVHTLKTGELLIQNNLTWTHSASNWTPGSGVRQVVGSFA